MVLNLGRVKLGSNCIDADELSYRKPLVVGSLLVCEHVKYKHCTESLVLVRHLIDSRVYLCE